MKKTFVIKESTHLEYKDFNNDVYQFIKNRIEFFFSNFDIVRNISEISTDENSIVVEINSINPILDIDLVNKMIDKLDSTIIGNEIKTIGHVPGTVPDRILYSNDLNKIDLKEKFVYSNLHEKYNSQLNIVKLKRQKIFIYLIKKIGKLHAKSLEEILEFFSSDEGTELILQYGEDVELINALECPYCNSSQSRPIYVTASQPTIGFLTNKSKYYYQCDECELVYLKKYFSEEDIHKVYDEYETEIALHKFDYKNLNKHNTSHFDNYRVSIDYLEDKLPSSPNIVDLGCGKGEFLAYAKEQLNNGNFLGIDYNIYKETRDFFNGESIDYLELNFFDKLNFDKKFDLITNWEVLEHIHLDKLDGYFKQVISLLNEDGYYVFSTPDFSDEYCQSNDFWAAFPPHHLSVFTKKWLYKYINKNGAKVVAEFHESVGMKTSGRWYKYASDFAPSKQIESYAKTIEQILEDDKVADLFRENMRRNNRGSEIILVVQKV